MGLKKILKKVGKGVKKAAPLVMAGLAAKALMGKGRRKANLAASYANVKDRHVPYDASEIAKGVLSQQHDSESDMYTPKKWYQKIFKKGGRAGKKGGGRTRKQFGGALGSTARRDMRSGYYPNDMGMRGGPMYKKGGRVKSMGAAKRGGGIAKR